MADTEYPVNHPAAQKLWSKTALVETLKMTYLAKFMGSSINSLIQTKEEAKPSGDKITIPLVMIPTGRGQSGDDTLEGNEESLATYTDSVVLNHLRHAIRIDGEMSEQRIPWDVRARAQEVLALWASDRIDTAGMYQLAGDTTQTDTAYTGSQTPTAPSSNRYVLAGDAAGGATASLGATDLYSYSLIDVLAEKAKLATPAMRPINVGGKPMYVNFIHTTQLTDLRRNTSTGEFLDIQKAILNGGLRPGDSAILDGGAGIYNGTIIHDSTRVPSGAANTRRAIFCGAQSAFVAFGRNSGVSSLSWKEKYFDYDNKFGVKCGMIWGLKKAVFNSEDFGVIVATSYAATHG